MTRLTSKVQLFAVLLLLSRSCTAFSNNATESLSREPSLVSAEDEPPTEDANQARNGGRRRQSEAMNSGAPEQSQVGCRELRSTKYISDGQCTSINPVKELVCAGECLPAHLLPNWMGSYWSRREAQEWRCVMERSRSQRIWLQCQDGSSRTYKITVVTSCKCKRYSRQHNDSRHKDAALASGKEKRKHRRDERSDQGQFPGLHVE
ncbi:sclerostin domain-containing protein 1b [Syngnathus scovelli]|uniref:sclerostin domain-containing protein 1b n=1 Tax=Syngnathus scovelli TaxID=161590 RepID=UPI00211098ED|nr:sclerostin domain-containing protein 1b [Syngnathus scovelli]XP_049607284.1 sclerostin domain-containing protein 1b [Syngnathus scovelli]